MTSPNIELKNYQLCAGFGYGMHQRPAVLSFFIKDGYLTSLVTGNSIDPHRSAIRLVIDVLNQALDLQKNHKIPVFGKPRCIQVSKQDKGILVNAAIPYYKPLPLMLAVKALLQESVTAGPDTSPKDWAKSIDTVSFSTEIELHRPVGTNLRHILHALYSANAECHSIHDQIYQLGFGPRAPRFISAQTDQTPAIAFNTACRKSEARELFIASGLPVARSIVVGRNEDATRAANELGGLVVVKPESSDGGHGVTAGISEDAEVAAAFDIAVRLSPKVLVEEYIEGDDFRLIFVSGKLVRAFGRRKQGVIGDGKSSVTELVNRTNVATTIDRKKLRLGEDELKHLANVGLTPESVPVAGQHVKLGELHNVSAGGIMFPVETKNIHPSFVAISLAAVNVLRLDIAGVDILTANILLPLEGQRAVITEVNANPQFGSDDQRVFSFYASTMMKRMRHDVRRELVIAKPGSTLYSHSANFDTGSEDNESLPIIIVSKHTVDGLPAFSFRQFKTTLQAAQAAHDSIESGTLRVVLTFKETVTHSLPFATFDSVKIDPGLKPGERQLLDVILDGHTRDNNAYQLS